MPKKTITDYEISLIKAMIEQKYKNKNIQFYFNKPERPVNSGRISEIKNGTYANSKDIPAASEEELGKFISKFSSTSHPINPQSGLTASSIHDPLSEEIIKSLFMKDSDGEWYLTQDENIHIECKSNFHIKQRRDKWLKALAALSNNNGGYIFFGVTEITYHNGDKEIRKFKVTGMTHDYFTSIDPADLSDIIKSQFDPTPIYYTTTICLDDKKVGVIYVKKHNSRPVISRKDQESISEGDIFYRYPGQSKKIKYSDLRAMLDTRDEEARMLILPMIEYMLKLGPQKTMVADLEQGHLIDGKTKIYLDNKIINKLNLIKEGEFTENSGAPTLKLIGSVQSLSTPPQITTEHKAITKNDIIQTFLDFTAPNNPTEYIRAAVESTPTTRLPVRYFARKANLKDKELIEFIDNTNASDNSKKTYIKWLTHSTTLKSPSGKPKNILDKILSGAKIDVQSYKDAIHASQAICALESITSSEKQTVIDILKKCLEETKTTPQAKSYVKKAIWHIDEIFHKQQ